MNKLLQFLNKPISRKKMPLADQSKLLNMMGELLGDGFSLNETLEFLRMIIKEQADNIDLIIADLQLGKRLDESLVILSFPKFITSQIYLAYHHGHLSKTLIMCGNQLENESKKRENLRNILIYPSFLIVFLVGMLLAMRYILLPHLVTDDDISPVVSFIYHSPTIILVAIITIILLVLYAKYYFAKRSKKEFASFLTRIPIISGLSKSYYSYYFTQEWSALLESGMSIKEVVSVMQEKETSPLLNEIGYDMNANLLQGKPVYECLSKYPFLHDELSEIIRHGEKTSNLQVALTIFSKDCYRRLNMDIEKLFQLIQPISFMFIALMVVAVYAALLLPMFDSIKTL